MRRARKAACSHTPERVKRSGETSGNRVRKSTGRRKPIYIISIRNRLQSPPQSRALPLVSGRVRTTRAAATAKTETAVRPVAKPYAPTR